MRTRNANDWSPLPLAGVVALLEGAPFPWWIAGGHAIELAVGRTLRSHDDTDVLVLHHDHEQVRAWMQAWDCWASDPPGTLRPWAPAERLPSSVHDVWCRDVSDGPWRLQLMFDRAIGEVWRSRRDARVSLPLSRISRRSGNGIPFLAPKVQLYYKAKTIRPKDVIDFEAALPMLEAGERRWLRDAIALSYGCDHCWLPAL